MRPLLLAMGVTWTPKGGITIANCDTDKNENSPSKADQVTRLSCSGLDKSWVAPGKKNRSGSSGLAGSQDSAGLVAASLRHIPLAP
jgi:hypothetical protein